MPMARTSSAEDGITFDADAVEGQFIREDARYQGVRLIVPATRRCSPAPSGAAWYLWRGRVGVPMPLGTCSTLSQALKVIGRGK